MAGLSQTFGGNDGGILFGVVDLVVDSMWWTTGGGVLVFEVESWWWRWRVVDSRWSTVGR